MSQGIECTRLRWVSSKDPDKLLVYVNSLPYKIELKGGMIFAKNKFYLSFVLPENPNLKEFPFGDLD